MENIQIRQALPSDLETLLRFEQGIIETERPFDPTLKKGHINYYDLSAYVASPDVEVVVAQIGDEVVGSGYALIREAKDFEQHTHYAYLGFMYVKPEHRGKGINQAILKALQQWAAGRGLTEIRLQVYDDNAAAVRAYEKAGFKAHMLVMRLDIGGE
jgi:GNAT superfamily N-acetyltransferase